MLGVICGYIRKRSGIHDGEAPITCECLATNALFYGFLFVGILFFWNWFNLLSPEFTAVGTDTIDLVGGSSTPRCRCWRARWALPCCVATRKFHWLARRCTIAVCFRDVGVADQYVS